MNEFGTGAFIVFLMFAFYHYATTYARTKDLRMQLINTLAELKRDSYVVRVGKSEGREWVELTNHVTRIFIAEEDGHEELWLNLFLPNAEAAGANATHLSRLAVERKRFGKILYQRTNKLSGVLLYYVTGVTRQNSVHALMNELIERTRAYAIAAST